MYVPQAVSSAMGSCDQFHVVKKLGSGYASSVYLGTCRQTGCQVAIKMYHKAKLSELNYFQISREIRIHAALDHQNILQLWAAFEDAQGVYLISEFAAKGDVFQDVDRRGGALSEADSVRQVIYPFLCALQYLHGNNIVHRDIKPENLLLNAMGVLKVADFGLSINVAEERPVTRVGTLDYMSPEVVICPDKRKAHENKELKHLYYGPLVDAWAVGVLAYELIVGKPPFDKGNKKATTHEILTGEVNVPPMVSDDARHFITWALTKDQQQRPSVSDLMEHPWVVKHMALSTSCKGIVRADSFVEPRHLMRGLAPLDSRDSQSMEQAAQNNRMLQSSVSMSAVDSIRFRDVRLELMRADAKSRAGSGSGAPPGAPGSCKSRQGSSSGLPSDKLVSKRSNGEDNAGASKQRVEQATTNSAIPSIGPPRKSVVIAPDVKDVKDSDDLSSKRHGLKKQVSFHELKPLSQAGVSSPGAPMEREKPCVVRSRTCSNLGKPNSFAAQPRPLSGSAVIGMSGHTPSGLGTPSLSGPLLAQQQQQPAAKSQPGSCRHATSPRLTIQDLQAELQRRKSQQTAHDALSPKSQDASSAGPGSPCARPSVGNALVPSSRHSVQVQGCATATIAIPTSTQLYSSTRNQDPWAALFGESQRNVQKANMSTLADQFRQPALFTGASKAGQATEAVQGLLQSRKTDDLLPDL